MKLLQKNRYRYFKGFLDYLFTLFLIPFFGFLFIIFSFLIMIDSSGGVLFIQNRVGFRGKIFKCYKFRTMKVGTPNVSTEDMQKLGLNPITRVGYWLRKTSLDELPQIINILLGQMSFIGPRPALPSQVSLLQMRQVQGVENILPGITGLAQVRGRDSLSDEEKVKLDTEYYHHFSFSLDMRILYETLHAVLSNKGNK